MDLVAVTAFGILYTIATLILLALGLAVIFGMMGVINLAQAEFLMVGAYTVLIVTAHGVTPARVYWATFAFGAALAGLGGAVMAPLTGVVPTLGLAFIAKIFITVIVGGPVILLGTTTAGAVLGLVESLVSYSSTPIYGQVAMLAVAIILLRLLPQGISGFWRRGA